MADRMPEHRDDQPARAYDGRGAEVIAFLGAVLLGAAIIALFMFITWVAYAAD